ncbi:MAG: FMN-binding protein, partial [Lachnospiraceae bacterium]|nr:FMN-binding protein [Lachnospiraceae bacterium]
GVDVVSRATYSSNAIIAGVQDALKQAAAGSSSDQTEDESESSEKSSSAQEEEETQESENDDESSEDSSAGQEEGGQAGEEESESSEDSSTAQDEGDSQEEKDGSESSESSGSEEGDEDTGYTDGSYSAQALCTDEDLFSYWLRIDLTVQNGLITGVDVTKYDDTSDDPDSNETYLNYAINGRTYRNVWYEGVVSQVLTLQSGDGVDVVSRATYSSNAIITGVQNALSQASAGSGE